MKVNCKLFFKLFISVLLLGFYFGCSSLIGVSKEELESEDIANQGIVSESTKDEALLKELRKKDRELYRLKADLQNKELAIENYKKELSAQAQERVQLLTEKNRAVDTTTLPPQALPGECYARVFLPPVYKTVTQRLLKKQASEKIQVIPAQYKWVEEKILVKEPSIKLVEVPATYKWVTDRILVKEAHTVWKKGRGTVERIDHSTGEIICRVNVPAQYKEVQKRVLVNPPTIKEVQLPAEYKTVKVRKLVKPAGKKIIPISAEYQTVTKKVKITEGKIVWKRVMCETNINPSIVAKIQAALRKAGYKPGPVDSIIGPRTTAAMTAYQKKKGLAQGNVTFETLKSLGINVAELPK